VIYGENRGKPWQAEKRPKLAFSMFVGPGRKRVSNLLIDRGDLRGKRPFWQERGGIFNQAWNICHVLQQMRENRTGYWRIFPIGLALLQVSYPSLNSTNFELKNRHQRHQNQKRSRSDGVLCHARGRLVLELDFKTLAEAQRSGLAARSVSKGRFSVSRAAGYV